MGGEGVTSTGMGRVSGCSGSDLLGNVGSSADPGPLFPSVSAPQTSPWTESPPRLFRNPVTPPPGSRALPPFPLPPTSARSDSRSQKGKEVRTGARVADKGSTGRPTARTQELGSPAPLCSGSPTQGSWSLLRPSLNWNGFQAPAPKGGQEPNLTPPSPPQHRG